MTLTATLAAGKVVPAGVSLMTGQGGDEKRVWESSSISQPYSPFREWLLSLSGMFVNSQTQVLMPRFPRPVLLRKKTSTLNVIKKVRLFSSAQQSTLVKACRFMQPANYSGEIIRRHKQLPYLFLLCELHHNCTTPNT